VTNNSDADKQLVILGGGLAGLSLAIQLKQRQPQLHIVVIERLKHPVAEAAHKVGESLVELSSHYFCNVLGLEQHLEEEQLPKLGLRFFFRPDSAQPPEERLLSTVELGARDFPHSPSYQLDRGIFENFLAERCQQLDILFLDDTRVTGLDIGAKEKNHQIFIENLETLERTNLECRWVVDACSRTSPIKRLLKLEKDSPHKVSAAWFRIACQLDITELNDSPEWHAGQEKSRWYSTNHFMGDGYWVWFIPLSSGSTSIGIVADNASHPLETYNTMVKAMAWLEQNESLLAAFIDSKIDLLQDFKVLRSFSHDCEKVFNKNRWFSTGEAGVFLDPFYSPGSDFIAISNTFICHLIDTDLNDKTSFPTRCLMLDRFYLNLFQNTAGIYQDQYPLFGHPVVMPVKILWDIAVYWSFTAFIFIQGRFDETNSLFRLRDHFEEIGSMTEHLQPLFKHWADHEPPHANAIYIDPCDIDYLSDLNQGLAQSFSSEDAFERQFLTNIQRLKGLYRFICRTAYARFPQLEDRLAPSRILNEEPATDLDTNQFESLLSDLTESDRTC
jgi:flavin-dependent dehydrogenase